jgi:hypothetical protein
MRRFSTCSFRFFTALFLEYWPLFKCLNPIQSRYDFLVGGPGRRKDNTNRINSHRHTCPEWDSTHNPRTRAGEEISYFKPRGHCDRLTKYYYSNKIKLDETARTCSMHETQKAYTHLIRRHQLRVQDRVQG